MISRRSILAASAALAASPVRAQTAWPSQPLRIIVPFTPGGSTDVLARIIGQKLEGIFKQPFIVDNKPGAGGIIGAQQVQKSPADGYTFLMGHIGTLAFNPSLYPKLPYDPQKDFAPVALVATVPNILAINPKLPVNTYAEFIAYAKANPGKLHYGTGGNGSAAHVATAYFCARAGIDCVHVPYKGTAPAITDLLAGQIQFVLTGGPAVLPKVPTGQLKVLAVSTRERVPFARDLPTIAESGLAGFEAVQWYGLVAPAGTPQAIIDRMNREINGLMDSPEIAKNLETDGALAVKVSPEAFGAHIAAEIALWREVIVQNAIKVE
jgi:tripartite-type tricarboxylate transporter receptor subunit TctC